MKITIDTSFKTVEVEGQCTMGELIEFLSKYYPDFSWKDLRISSKIQTYTGYTGTTLLGHSGTYTGTGTTGTMGPIGIQGQAGISQGPFITFCSDTNTISNSATGETSAFSLENVNV